MRVAAILWNIFLAIIATGGVALVGPRVYEYAHRLFTNRENTHFLRSVTFEGFMVMAAFLACMVALSYAFNRRLGVVARTVAVVLVAVLLGGWVAGAVLWTVEAIPVGVHDSVISRMIGFDGALFMVIALVSLGVAAAIGRGPLALAVELLRKRSKKQNDAA